MQQFDDFEENLNVVIKWLMIVCFIAILVWCVMSVVKAVMPDNDDSNGTSQELVKSNEAVESSLQAMQELSDDEGSSSPEEEMKLLLNDGEAQSSSNAGYTFQVNVREMPDNLYFETLKTDENREKKQEIINQKVGENYIESVLSYGAVERWNPETFPLKIYIAEPKEVPHSHINEIKNAFTKWQETTNNFVTFAYVDSADKADIVCSYPKDFYRTCSSDETSQFSKQYFTYSKDGYIKKSNIELTYQDCNNQTYAEDVVYAFALREIGHSLGLRGHSGKFQDKILYYPTPNRNESVRPEINIADVNTLKLIYSVLPDKTNSELSETQRKKLINPADIWGDTMERTASSEKAILYNIERSPDIPNLHIALANHYKEQGQYDKALEGYSRSIVLLNDAAFKARVYVKVGDTYSSQHRYLEAVEAYKLSLKTLNDKASLFNVYFNLGFIYYQQARYDEAMEAYQTAIQFVPNKESFFKLLMNLTSIYIKVGNNENAQKCAEKALSLFATKDSLYLAAYTHFLNEEYTEAEKYMVTSVEKYGSLMGYALLAQIYYKTNQYGKLKRLQEQANEAYPENPPFVFQ